MKGASFLLRLALASAPLLIIQYPHDIEKERLHKLLLEFLSRGQLVVETLPPLTFLIQPFMVHVWHLFPHCTSISVSNTIAELLILTSILLAFTMDSKSCRSRTTFLLEAATLLPVFFGCNISDILLCMLLVQLKRTFLAFQRLEDRQTSIVSRILKTARLPADHHSVMRIVTVTMSLFNRQFVCYGIILCSFCGCIS